MSGVSGLDALSSVVTFPGDGNNGDTTPGSDPKSPETPVIHWDLGLITMNRSSGTPKGMTGLLPTLLPYVCYTFTVRLVGSPETV